MNSDTYDNSGYVVDIPPEQLADKVEELIVSGEVGFIVYICRRMNGGTNILVCLWLVSVF